MHQSPTHCLFPYIIIPLWFFLLLAQICSISSNSPLHRLPSQLFNMSANEKDTQASSVGTQPTYNERKEQSRHERYFNTRELRMKETLTSPSLSTATGARSAEIPITGKFRGAMSKGTRNKSQTTDSPSQSAAATAKSQPFTGHTVEDKKVIQRVLIKQEEEGTPQ